MNKRYKKKFCYYVDMPHNLIATEMEGPTNIIIPIIDLKDPSMQEQKEQNLPSLTQEVMFLHNLLLLLHLSIRQMKGNESLVNYNMSHVVTFE